MYKTYFIHAFKRILRYNTYSLINIFGLAVGLASFIIIALYVIDEYSFDRFHKNADRIYRITSVIDFNGVGEKSSSQPFPMGQAFADDYPDHVETYVRFFNLQKSQFLIRAEKKVFNERRFFYADANVFDVFDFELIKGNKDEVLIKPFTIVITESIAKKYFEDLDPVGKHLQVDNFFDYEITGVIKDIKAQSHLKFDFLASFSSLSYIFKNEKIFQAWVWNPCWTYLLLKTPESAPELEKMLPSFVKKHFKTGENENYRLSLQPITDIHLKSKLDYEISKNSDEKYVRLLMILGFLILAIATINYVNLATASASNRAREIGIKKVSGAGRAQLIGQFLGESMLTVFISMLVAISLVELFLPAFREISGKYITYDFRFKKETLIGLFCIWLFTGFIAGIYPAVFLSSFKATNLLRRDFKLGSRSTNFRKALVLVQFSISVLLIITTIGVFRQLEYLHTADLGFKKNNIVIIDAGYEISGKYASFKENLLKESNIQEVTAMNYIIGSSHNTYPFIFENSISKEFQYYPAIFVRDHFVKTFEIDIVSGRDFTEGEKAAGNELLVNEEMVRYVGLEKNEEILGKKFHTGWRYEEVVGVFSNINITSLHHQVEPFVIKMARDSATRDFESKYIVIRINQDELASGIRSIEKVWDAMGYERPFEYQFLQDILDAHYSGEDILGELARIFTVLSIIISLLGIWGLTAYITERRTREIGIRKTLGASMFSLVKLINKEFVLIIIISILISWPLSFFALSNWIKSFAYRDFLSIWSFILASMLAVLFAILTISHKAIIAGRKNPVDAIRYE